MDFCEPIVVMLPWVLFLDILVTFVRASCKGLSSKLSSVIILVFGSFGSLNIDTVYYLERIEG